MVCIAPGLWKKQGAGTKDILGKMDSWMTIDWLKIVCTLHCRAGSIWLHHYNHWLSWGIKDVCLFNITPSIPHISTAKYAELYIYEIASASKKNIMFD